MRSLLTTLLLSTLITTSAAAQEDGINPVWSWNLLDFSGESTDRVEAFRTVLKGYPIDALFAQEVVDEAGVQLFLDSVLNVIDSNFVATPYIDGPGSDNILFYKPERVQLLEGPTALTTPRRDIIRVTLRLEQVSFHDTFIFYNINLSEGLSAEDAALRTEQVRILYQDIKTLSTHTPYWAVGTMNFTENTEQGYRLLSDSLPNSLRVFQSHGWSGNWYNKEGFSSGYTFSTRVREFGGGSGGGLRAQADMMLSSRNNSNYLRTYGWETVGNDGMHFGDSINAGTNDVVGNERAQALHDASDHLPLYINLSIWEGSVPGSTASDPDLFSVIPQEDGTATIRFRQQHPEKTVITVHSVTGESTEVLMDEFQPRGKHALTWDTSRLPSGCYILTLSNPSGLHTAKVVIRQ